jgi:hypothetical protein
VKERARAVAAPPTRAPRRPIALLVLAGALAACATFAPPIDGVYRAPDVLGALALAEPGSARPAPPALLALVGDVGAPQRMAEPLAARLAGRLDSAPGAPVLVLGDVFYGSGLLGACPPGDTSRRRCAEPGAPEQQLEAVLGPYRRSLGGRPLVALAGNHDHQGDPDSTAIPCRLLHGWQPGWSYVASGCGLDAAQPVAVLDVGPLAVVMIDSERMLRDASFRAASARALEGELARLNRAPARRWIAVAAHHPLESYGAHNGASFGAALLKDLHWLRTTLLLPLGLAAELAVPGIGAQDVYSWRYRAYRRALYAVFREQPIDLFAAGHDHNLQWIEIEQPGVRAQLVSGSAAKRDAVKRFGLDLFWSNRLARRLGLGDLLPAPEHRLVFASGRGSSRELSGHGFAVLSGDGERLRAEFFDAAVAEPLYVEELDR